MTGCIGLGLLRAAPESSGLARSGHDATRFWTVNDSGNTPVLYALGLDGQIQAALPVADALRPHVALYLVAEPAVLDGVDSLPLRRLLRLRYPDGAATFAMNILECRRRQI